MIADPAAVPVDQPHQHEPATESWAGRVCDQVCSCGAARTVEWPSVHPIRGAGSEPSFVGDWEVLPPEPMPSPGAIIKGLLHAELERVADHAPLEGLERYRDEVERAIVAVAEGRSYVPGDRQARERRFAPSITAIDVADDIRGDR